MATRAMVPTTGAAQSTSAGDHVVAQAAEPGRCSHHTTAHTSRDWVINLALFAAHAMAGQPLSQTTEGGRISWPRTHGTLFGRAQTFPGHKQARLACVALPVGRSRAYSG